MRADRVRPVLVVGISGATWTVIRPMLAEGALPALAALMRAGSSGVLASVKVAGDEHYRPQTAWPSVWSGKVPERHGITRWFHTARDLSSACLWDAFAAAGLPVGLYAAPLLWPPPRLNGFVVPALYARDGSAWPAELSYISDFYRRAQDAKHSTRTLSTLARAARFAPLFAGRAGERRLGARLLARAARLALVRDREERALLLRQAKLDFGTAVFLALYARYRPRLALFTSFELDFISHRYWRYHEPARFPGASERATNGLGRAVRDAYAHVDRCIALLLERVPPDSVVAVVSEHGMAAEPRSGELGRWRYVIDGARVQALAGLDPALRAVPIARWVVYRRPDGGPLEERVEQALARLTVVESGRPLFRTHRHGDDEVVIKLDLEREHHGDIADVGALHVRAPDRGVVPIQRLLARAGPTRSAMHAKEGVLVLKGPGIRADAGIEGARVTDVMPTLLHAAGLDVPGDLDGTVLDVFA